MIAGTAVLRGTGVPPVERGISYLSNNEVAPPSRNPSREEGACVCEPKGFRARDSTSPAHHG